MPEWRTPQPLQQVMQGLIDDLGIRRKLDEVRAVEAWAALAGPQINAVTDSAWVKGGRLYVRIHSSAWRQELHLSRSGWRRRLNEQLGGDYISEIVFR